MKEYYQSISFSDTREDLIQKFLKVLTTDGILLKNYQETFNFLLTYDTLKVEYYSSEEIDAIEHKWCHKWGTCDCIDDEGSDDEDDLAHKKNCASINFKFENSLAFEFSIFEKRFDDGVERRFHAWQRYKKYFYVWQKFCLPLRRKIETEYQVSQFLQEILLVDLEKICSTYAKERIEFVGPLFFVSYDKNEDIKTLLNQNFPKRDGSDYTRILKMKGLVSPLVYEALAHIQDWQQFRVLCGSGHLEAAKIYYKEFIQYLGFETDSDAFASCIKYKQFEVARWLYSLDSISFSQDVNDNTWENMS